jgi:hypothetical protein
MVVSVVVRKVVVVVVLVVMIVDPPLLFDLQLVIHDWEGNHGTVGLSIRNTMEMILNAWFSIFFTKNMINNIVHYTN